MKSMNQTVPKAYRQTVPRSRASAFPHILAGKRSTRRPPTKAHARYPTRYPPVGPTRTASPPRAPENTGIPTDPIMRYTPTGMTLRTPRKTIERYSTRVASVIGTAPTGRANGERTHNTAAKRAYFVSKRSFMCVFNPLHRVLRSRPLRYWYQTRN